MCMWHAGRPKRQTGTVTMTMSIVNYLRGGGIVMHGALLTTKRAETLLTTQSVRSQELILTLCWCSFCPSLCSVHLTQSILLIIQVSDALVTFIPEVLFASCLLRVTCHHKEKGVLKTYTATVDAQATMAVCKACDWGLVQWDMWSFESLKYWITPRLII